MTTGLHFEADVLRLFISDNLSVRVAGLGPGTATAAAEALVGEGARALVSFGIAAGLDPLLEPGSVIVPCEIRGERTIACDGSWVARLRRLVDSAIDTAPQALADAPAILTTPAQKAALFAQTGAAAADMESHAVAAVAQRHNLPFIALRAIADTAHDAVPTVALTSMGHDGHVRVGAAIAGALSHPWQIPGLIRLGARTARATTALAALARAHAPGGFGLV